TLIPTATSELVVGVDHQANEHTNRSTMNQMMMRYQDAPRVPDAEFKQVGIFGEWTQKMAGQQRLIAGVRFDDWSATDLRATRSVGMADLPNPTAGLKRGETLSSGFLRYEKDLQTITAYAGLGRSQRFPDYWELMSREATDSLSAFRATAE